MHASKLPPTPEVYVKLMENYIPWVMNETPTKGNAHHSPPSAFVHKSTAPFIPPWIPGQKVYVKIKGIRRSKLEPVNFKARYICHNRLCPG